MHGPVEAAGTKVVRQLARQGRPKLIVVGFGPAPRIWRLEEFRALADEVGAHLVVDMSQAAGLVSTGLLPNPVDIADIVTTIHDNVADWSGGAILCRSSYAQRLESGLPREGGGSEAGQTRNKLDGLTAKERAVAERVSQGLTNQEVADDLFVSAKTIEYHLGNIYAKLGIRTRRDLRRHYGTQCAQCGRSCAESA
jgi:glycine/serine hydroxymethyltransferase